MLNTSIIASEKLDIVNLIEKNPITRFNRDYQNKFIHKIQEKFSETQQHLFIGSFYCYLNYTKNDFVIDLENVWKWLGFSRKDPAKVVLEKHFIINVDYIVSQQPLENPQLGGRPKENIMLNINTFKKLCLKSNTKKADEIHDYFIKLEETFQEIINEESNELRLQLQNTIIELKENNETEKNKLKKEKRIAVEKAIVVQFPVNIECIYIGTIDNTNDNNEKLIKFGHTNDLSTRIKDHHKHYNNFALINAFRVQNKVEIENLIKTHSKIRPNIRTIEVNDKNKTEIIAYNTDFTIEHITKIIKELIESKIYSIDNFNKLVKENEELANKNIALEKKVIDQNSLIVKQLIEINEMKNTIENQVKAIQENDSAYHNISPDIQNTIVESIPESVYQNILLPQNEMTEKFNQFVNEVCIVGTDVQEISANIEGRFRIWNQNATKKMFHALKNYMDFRFRQVKIDKRHGYIGIKLRKAEYKKTNINSDAQTFIFEVCKFSDTGKITYPVLENEYKKWKLSVNKELHKNDLDDIKNYLNCSPYALKGSLWITGQNTHDGFYGVSLKNYEEPKGQSSTGKRVEKRLVSTNELLGSWDTIASASTSANVSAAKMSRLVKNKKIIDNTYYMEGKKTFME
jgi:phage anti-repressor protein